MGAIRPSFTRRHLAGLTLSLWKESPLFCLRPASEDSDVNPSKQPVLPSQKDTGRSPVSHPLPHPSVWAGPPASHQMLSCSLRPARPALWLFTCSGRDSLSLGSARALLPASTECIYIAWPLTT